MADFIWGIILSIVTGVAFSLGGILTRIGAKKFRGNLLPKYKQNLFFGLQITFLNTFFILGVLFSVLGTAGKVFAPMVGNTTIAITIIYSTSYIATIIFGTKLLKEKISRLELLAVAALMCSIIFVCLGVVLASGGL